MGKLRKDYRKSLGVSSSPLDKAIEQRNMHWATRTTRHRRTERSPGNLVSVSLRCWARLWNSAVQHGPVYYGDEGIPRITYRHATNTLVSPILASYHRSHSLAWDPNITTLRSKSRLIFLNADSAYW